MLISKNWLQDYVFLPDSLSSEELAQKMTLGIVEVEEVFHEAQLLNNVVVGIVKSVEKHPDADKLNVCQVEVGNGEIDQVVCGGSNVVEGMKVAMGRIGAMVRWHGEGDLVELKPVKIRGVASAGMICASDEIGLLDLYPKQDEKEIMDISTIDAAAGTPLAEVLEMNDVVIDVDNKSMTHRPDLWGHYGMAREIAAIYRKKLEPLKLKEIKEGSDVTISTAVADSYLCPRYMAVALDGIKVAPSPQWMQKRLMAVGIRPINNIVDITNFVMLELGQPMHGFDASHLETTTNTKSQSQNIAIQIRNAKKGETIQTLDGGEHELSEEMLVIADSKKPIAVAGVMGGNDSAVSDETTSIVFEAATFDAVSVRKTATKLGLRTDSSARFEKSLDPNLPEIALARAVALTLELCPEAKVISNVADEQNFSLNQGPIELPLAFLNEKIGVEVEKKRVIDILERLGFTVKEKKDVLNVTIPSWRATKDIGIPEDLVEEVARMYGYDNIEPTLPTFPVVPPQKNELIALEMDIKRGFASGHGYSESRNYSYVSPEAIVGLGLEVSAHIELDNPIAKDRPFLRRTLLSGLLENVEKNTHRFEIAALCETGRTYLLEEPGLRAGDKSDELLPRQDTMFAAVFAAKGVETPFHHLADALRSVCGSLGAAVTLTSYTPNETYMHPGRSAEVRVADTVVGYISELHPATQKAMGIPYRTAFVEMNLNKVLELRAEVASYTPLALFPSVLRDVAFIVDASIAHADVVAAIEGVDPLIRSIELFDVYQGKHVGEGNKSMAYHIEYRSDEGTLEAAAVDKVHEKVMKMLKKQFKAEERS